MCVKPGEREREREEKGGVCVCVCVCEGVDPGKKKSVCVEGVVVCGEESVWGGGGGGVACVGKIKKGSVGGRWCFMGRGSRFLGLGGEGRR